MDTQNFVNGLTTNLSFSKDELKQLLIHNTVKVTFTKKDGTDRTMTCTLQEGIAIPHEKTTDRVKQPKDDLLPVWDIEANGWRTITVPNIKMIESYNDVCI